MESHQANTPMWASEQSLERPPNDRCKDCGTVTEPWLRPEIAGLPARYLRAQKLCGDCVTRRALKEERLTAQRHEQERIHKAFRDSMLSPRFRERTFACFRPAEGHRMAFRAAMQFDPENSEGKGLLFYGPCGVGKTHLAAAIANKFMGKVPILYIPCPDFLDELREGQRNGERSNRMRIAKNVRLLIIDDLGAEKASEWVSEQMFKLLGHRYEYKLPTIITSNDNLDTLARKLGDRISSRLAEMCECIEMLGEDWRLNMNEVMQEV